MPNGGGDVRDSTATCSNVFLISTIAQPGGAVALDGVPFRWLRPGDAWAGFQVESAG